MVDGRARGTCLTCRPCRLFVMGEREEPMMRKWLVSLLAVTAATTAALQVAPRSAGADEKDGRTFVVDVAIDATTLALNNNDPSDPGNPKRGSTFTVTGKIFPGGTIPAGTTSFDPNQPGSIGNWICSGVFLAAASEIFGGTAPIAVHTSQIFMFTSDRKALMTEGLEGPVGVTTHRVVVGGTGAYQDMVGQSRQDTIGLNGTGLFDHRFTFRLVRAGSD